MTPIHPYVLLTGSGFTNAVNAYLTVQIWEHAFNQPEVVKDDILRREMLNNRHNLNYEKIYDVLRSKQGWEKSFQNYLITLDRVFCQIDDVIRVSVVGENKSHRVNLSLLHEWLLKFQGQKEAQGFIFTLNHDLFLERQLGKREGSPRLPGIDNSGQASCVRKTATLEKIKVAKETTEEKIRGDLSGFNLIKLHGSSNWTYEDGTTTMITGQRKDLEVKRHPLFDAYGKLLADVLSNCKGQLWIIGYGFGDDDINTAIVQGVKNGLSVYIADLSAPKDLLNKIPEVRPAVHGYVRNSLAGIFPSGEGSSIPLKEIESLMSNVGGNAGNLSQIT